MCYFSSFWVEEKKKKEKLLPELRRKSRARATAEHNTENLFCEHPCPRRLPAPSVHQQSAARRGPTFQPLLGVFERLGELP